jgi:hypothetical protein
MSASAGQVDEIAYCQTSIHDLTTMEVGMKEMYQDKLLFPIH